MSSSSHLKPLATMSGFLALWLIKTNELLFFFLIVWHSFRKFILIFLFNHFCWWLEMKLLSQITFFGHLKCLWSWIILEDLFLFLFKSFFQIHFLYSWCFIGTDSSLLCLFAFILIIFCCLICLNLGFVVKKPYNNRIFCLAGISRCHFY